MWLGLASWRVYVVRWWRARAFVCRVYVCVCVRVCVCVCARVWACERVCGPASGGCVCVRVRMSR